MGKHDNQIKTLKTPSKIFETIHMITRPCTSGGSCEATSGAKGTTGSEGGEGEVGPSTEDTVDRAAEAEARNLERRVSRVRRLASARTPRDAAMRTSDFSWFSKGEGPGGFKPALLIDGF